MYKNDLVIYRNITKDRVFSFFACLLSGLKREQQDRDFYRDAYYNGLQGLVDVGLKFGFSGDLWHAYLTLLLVNDENAYSLACEGQGLKNGSLNQVVQKDFNIIQGLFHFDFQSQEQDLEVSGLSPLRSFENPTSKAIINTFMRNTLVTLSVSLGKAQNVEEFQALITAYYHKFGVGKYGMHKAFRVNQDKRNQARITPIVNIANVQLDDLVGYEVAKKKLIDNTLAFIEGRPANNCLLFGDAGTGKSSSIKGILNKYFTDGLRMIEVYKHQFQDLNSIIQQIENRSYKFIIYMDDLSFEEFETEYKYLKAVIEGGLENKPENVLIYATSNRRHLIRENFRDKEERDSELHSMDTIQEKHSLYHRFGVSIYFGAPTRREFETIVLELSKRHGVPLSEAEILKKANQWEMSHGGKSGRTARQFVDYLLGMKL